MAVAVNVWAVVVVKGKEGLSEVLVAVAAAKVVVMGEPAEVGASMKWQPVAGQVGQSREAMKRHLTVEVQSWDSGSQLDSLSAETERGPLAAQKKEEAAEATRRSAVGCRPMWAAPRTGRQKVIH